MRLNDRAAYNYADAWHKNALSLQPTKDPASSSGPNPDIYYIILDGYGRSDILDSLYHLDNSSFYSFLTRKGFYIADQSHTNYIQTPLSLASSLNSMYLDPLASEVGDQSGNKAPLAAMIEDNRLFRQLHDRRYAVVTFSTGFDLTDIKTSDVYLSPPGALDAFQNAFLSTTPLPLFLDLPFLKSQYQLHRESILYNLDHLGDLTNISGPKMVFCHILAPHPPFVFGANGEQVQPVGGFDLSDGSSYVARTSQSDYAEGYRNQLIFVTARVELMISQLLARSPTPPVIIIQGDHGPGSRLDWASAQNTYLPERLSILNAYYFPDQDYSLLYPSITPVNSFRVVLSQYFGLNLQLLPDHSYFSTLASPYAFIDVTNQLGTEPKP